MLLPSLLLSGLIASAHGAFDCRNLELDGRKYDMSALKRVSWSTEKPTPPTIKKVFYDFDLCQPLPAPSPPNNPDFCPTGTRLCRTVSTARQGLEDRIVSVIPIAGDIGQSDFGVTLEKAPEPEAIVLRIRGGMYESVAQLARIVMVCDVNARETAPAFVSYEPKTGFLALKWITAAACPLASDGTPTPPPNDGGKPDAPSNGGNSGGSSSSGMGFFGWFFTVFLIALVAYFVGGAFNNYTQYGSTGFDMIPHRDLWRDLPFLVTDMFRGRGGSRSGYSALG